MRVYVLFFPTFPHPLSTATRVIPLWVARTHTEYSVSKQIDGEQKQQKYTILRAANTQ